MARLYQNFFQPSAKLLSKERTGAKVTKRYDEAKTPYQRVLATDQVDQSVKDRLRETFNQLNPADLKRKILGLQKALSEASAEREPLVRDVAAQEPVMFL